MSGWSNGGGPRATRSLAVPEGQSHFWEFSLTVYGGPGVQEECLLLQDRYGVDINVLLFCAYVGAIYGALLSDLDVRAAAAVQANGIRRLSAVCAKCGARLSRLHGRFGQPRLAGLRTAVKTAELEAERIEQMMLEDGAYRASKPGRARGPKRPSRPTSRRCWQSME